MHGPALGQSSPFVAKLQRAVELAADHASAALRGITYSQRMDTEGTTDMVAGS